MMKILLDLVETRKLVDKEDSTGDTALHYCSYSGSQSPVVRVENAKILLQAGASLTSKNNDGKTPYKYAQFRRRKEFAQYLWSQLSPMQRAQATPPSYWGEISSYRGKEIHTLHACITSPPS